MHTNKKFIKKNDSELFKQFCFEFSQQLDIQIEKLDQIRTVVYSCVHRHAKPLIDSQLNKDLKMINKYIEVMTEDDQKTIFQKTLITFYAYKNQFDSLNYLINTKLKEYSYYQTRPFSTNRKLYENIVHKREILYNFYNSLSDCDSPTKIREDVFKF
ncbi:hypothetical protein ABPG74_000166 [Tetrahymena malaccensis]